MIVIPPFVKNGSLLSAAMAALIPAVGVSGYASIMKGKVNEAEGLGDTLRNFALRMAARIKGYQNTSWKGVKGDDPWSAAVMELNGGTGALQPRVRDKLTGNKIMITAPKSDPAITAHELGHVNQPGWLKSRLYSLGRSLPVPLGVAGAFTHKYPRVAVPLTAASALSSVPMIAAEADASRRGYSYLKGMKDPNPMEAYVGLPTYLAAGLGPAAIAVIAGRKFR